MPEKPLGQRYRILGAMARRPKFTVDDLVTQTGCKASVIRGVIDRYKHWLESDTSSTGRPGAPIKTYWLKSKQRKALISELNELFGSFAGPVFVAHDAKLDEQTEPWPIELVAAEYLIYQKYDKVNLEDRNALLSEIRANLDVAKKRLTRGDSFRTPLSEIKSRIELANSALHTLEKPEVPRKDSEAVRVHELTLEAAHPKEEAIRGRRWDVDRVHPDRVNVLVAALTRSVSIVSVVQTALEAQKMRAKIDDFSFVNFEEVVAGSQENKNVLMVVMNTEEKRDYSIKMLEEIDRAMGITALPAGTLLVDSGENTAAADRAEALHGEYVGNVCRETEWPPVNAAAVGNLMNALDNAVDKRRSREVDLLNGL